MLSRYEIEKRLSYRRSCSGAEREALETAKVLGEWLESFFAPEHCSETGCRWWDECPEEPPQLCDQRQTEARAWLEGKEGE